MPHIDRDRREVNFKLVYHGPGMSGKTTNLQYVYAKTNPETRSRMVVDANEFERVIRFDFSPSSLGDLHGYKIRIHLYTVPG
jgi:GTPase SAR1 family protein